MVSTGLLVNRRDRLIEFKARLRAIAVVSVISAAAKPGEQILVMSTGGLGGIHGKLLQRLTQ